jgi:hypothetical protein
MTPRERRLKSDFERIKNEFTNHPFIKVEYEKAEGNFPERYFVYYNIKGLKLKDDSAGKTKNVEVIENHKVEIYLHLEYPRMKPMCFMKSEIFHPNVRKSSPNDICIGDYWAPGETLTDIIYLIGDMIQFLNYNVRNPLNGVAAKWAKENPSVFPVGNQDLRLPEIQIDFKN